MDSKKLTANPYQMLKRITATCFILLAQPAKPSAQTLPLDGILPEELTAGFILRMEDFPPERRHTRFRLRLDAEGRPHILIGRSLIGLKDRQDRKPVLLRIPGKEKIDDFTWLPDGTFLAVSEDRLGVPGKDRFHVILTLPDRGMRITPADPGRFYIHGGGDEQRRNLYLYEKGGRLTHLLRLPFPIVDVTGIGNVTFVAAGRTIYLVAQNRPITRVYEAKDDLRSLVLAPTGGLFYATDNGVGYLRGLGAGFTFLKGRGAEIAVFGEDLYLSFADLGMLKASPVSSFERLVATLFEEAAASYSPEALFGRAKAEYAKGGRELSAIAWYRAYLAAAPKAGNARRVRERIIELEVEVEAKVQELLNKAGAVAAMLADGDSRIQAFRRIAAIMARAGNIAGAGKIAASLASAFDRDFVFMSIAVARMRDGDFKGAMKTVAGIETAALSFASRREIAWVQAYSGDIAGAWKTADSISGDQEKSRAYVRIADAEFSVGNAAGAGKAIASAKKAASRIPLEALRSYSHARIVEAQVKGNDLAGARQTASLVSYKGVRARVDSLIANTRPATNLTPSNVIREEIDAWTKIAETRLNKHYFVDFQRFWRSLRDMDMNDIVEELLKVSSDFTDALNLLRETEMLWWTRRTA